MTFQPNGSNRRVNRAWQMPRSYEEMVQRRKALQAWAALSCGFLGRSPDHLAPRRWSASAWASTCSASTAPSAPRRSPTISITPRKNDLFLTYVIINPQAERGKEWGEQAEDLVARDRRRGRRAASPSAAPRCSAPARSWPTKCFVANLQPLKPGEEDARLLLRAADERQGPAHPVAQVLRGSMRCRSSTIRSRRASTRTTR